MKPENLLNWGEMSRILSGSRCSLTKKRIPKKHEKSIKDLLSKIQTWYNEHNLK
jgi:hypothetical protein